ncbi:MAG: hypothetical protein SWH78_08025 [Thermodesulfobacteriota bacterium]|nr:hypothetical protein [Thermodesulfobacteriota bacterium]
MYLVDGVRNGNMEERIPREGDEEIGLLATWPKEMCDSLNDILKEIDGEVTKLGRTTQTLSWSRHRRQKVVGIQENLVICLRLCVGAALFSCNTLK